ncbi:MAG: DEAD/DEAH box helicase [Bacteroidaceae bacterium]
MRYTELPLISPIQDAISKVGYTEPTPIQEVAIPIVLSGQDLLGCAQTGTGKTASFTLPILQMLEKSNHRDGIKALIVTPTRELAIQIDDCITQYAVFMKNIKHTVVFGGVNANPQINDLKQGVQILVATPGRLLDLQSQGYVNLKKLEFFVLDEADRMLDMGFIHDIKRLLKLIPVRRQTLFFSATMPTSIATLSKKILTNPKRVDITPVSSTAEQVTQELCFVSKSNKPDLLLHLLKDPSLESVLIFTRTKHGADRVVKFLTKEKITSAAIHGNKSQNARQRALSGFKEHNIRVLIATDIAARGIDVDKLSHVINYELPNVPETYIHRIGRTGRAGREGIAISFCEAEEVPYLNDIEKLIKTRIPRVTDHPYAEEFSAADVKEAAAKKPSIRANARRSDTGRNGRSGSSRPNPNRSSSSRSNSGSSSSRKNDFYSKSSSRNSKPSRY